MATVLELKKDIESQRQASHNRGQQLLVEQAACREQLAAASAELKCVQEQLVKTAADHAGTRKELQDALSQTDSLQVKSLSSMRLARRLTSLSLVVGRDQRRK